MRTTLFILLLAACARTEVLLPPAGALASGTWGGEDAGLLLQDSLAHVHIGCTNGFFPAPIKLDENGRFTVTGRYVVRAYPVQMGPDLPAQMAGVINGGRLTFTVAVDDTVENKVTLLGPVTVTYGREPTMRNCPICRSKIPRSLQ